ncbi:CDP-2,3-bis-(O-geranylgeranyl)-sn-glycerol synthase [Candidatus Micrarchaeota archaeon]|nr:CDP-2,3-bis-(O-geranylgeranyl)-sn-glycerol synthase [Candidatus Micrarchaeota archaeon]
MEFPDTILNLLIFLIPAYISNSLPVLLGGGMPLDLNAKFYDGERILGDGKTIRGFLGGVFAGAFFGGLLSLVIDLPFYRSPMDHFIGGFLLSLGTMTGDSIGSFIKRRMKMNSGKAFFLDTVFFLIVALIFVIPAVRQSVLFTPFNIAFCLVLTAILHPVTNWIANRAGLKKVPW